MKIAHISDLHLDKNYKRNNYHRTLQLLEYIKEEKFDHIIITGDITENAEASAFEMARNIFKKFGLLNSDRLTLAIGNHDIYGGVHLAEDIINFPKKCKATDFGSKINEFEFYFKETFDKTIRPKGEMLFPCIKEFDEFILINLNSIALYSVLKNPFASNGRISLQQLSAAEELLQMKNFSEKQKIVITHHHFNKQTGEDDVNMIWQVIDRQTMKLRKKKSILKRFRDLGITVVLHGHIHESAEYSRKNIRFLNNGGSILSVNQTSLHINSLIVNKSVENRLTSITAYDNKPLGSKDFSFSLALYESSLKKKNVFLN